MAEFQIVAKAYDRMCNSYPTCEGCPINEHSHDIDACRCRVLKWPCKYESKIITWAVEHPEPVYPTWVEWFREMGIIPSEQKCFHSWLLDTIPADIAKKLGLKQKEK